MKSSELSNKRIRIREAIPNDISSLFSLINDSYQVETGNSGVAFKKTLRLIDVNTEMVPLIPRTLVAEFVSDDVTDKDKDAVLEELAGSITWEETEHDDYKAMHFGPFAVSTRHQKMGVGSALLNALYQLAQKRDCEYIDLECVNWRTDIIPWYQAMGFKVIGEGSFPAPERCTRDCHFILMRRKVSEIELY